MCAQLIYCVSTVHIHAQWPLYYAARFTQHPTRLYRDVLEYQLHHLYDTRHIGLTLGGVGAGAQQVEMHHVSPADAASLRTAAAHTDSGHAEPGPSTGGHTIDLGGVTIHAVTGQHHAVTLSTTDSEMYELSRAVAALLGFRDLCTEIGYPQSLPSPVHCDNAGGVFKATEGKSDKRSLYMRRRTRFVQDAEQLGAVAITKIRSALNRADLLTKKLNAKTFKSLRDMMLNVRAAAANLHFFVGLQRD